MCGIAGFAGAAEPPGHALEAALRAIGKRGPDGKGLRLFGSGSGAGRIFRGALLHTRLAIRDLSANGAQPMSNEDGSIWIAFNGECYGWEAGRAELEARGHRFRSRTDTEFILHGYEEWGAGVLPRLRGMFAFAIFDTRKNRVFCARDRLGKKPFYFKCGDDGFFFGSNLAALAALAPARLELDPAGIDAFLAHRYIPAPLTLFKGVSKLPPAHFLEFDVDSPASASPLVFWEPSPRGSADLLATLRESVALRLVADRPVGIFLSGGVDSQAVASLVRGHSGLSAFTASFGDRDFDEAREAAAAASDFGLRHEVLSVEMDPGAIDGIVGDLDEPFADPSAIPTWYLCREASRKVKVALTGDGGDELFAGYKRYAKHLAARRFGFPVRLPGPPLHAGGGWINKSTLAGRISKILLGSSLGWQAAYALRFSGIDPATRSFLQPSMGRLPAHRWRLPDPSVRWSPLGWMLECDRLNYLPEYILKKGDLCGMAHGLELRNPLLDHFFFEAVLAMPAGTRVSRHAKSFLRRISNRAHTGAKRGFNPPIGRWLSSPAMQARLAQLPKSLGELTHGQLEPKRVRAVALPGRASAENGEWLWQFLVLEISLRRLTVA